MNAQKFTKKSLEAIQRAQALAVEYANPQIEQCHLLYALLEGQDGLNAQLFKQMGIQAGANVIMPNLSPVGVRKKYELYDGKICTGEESAQCRGCLQQRMESIGYEIVTERGDIIK